jgi:hypothetical protein
MFSCLTKHFVFELKFGHVSLVNEGRFIIVGCSQVGYHSRWKAPLAFISVTASRIEIHRFSFSFLSSTLSPPSFCFRIAYTKLDVQQYLSLELTNFLVFSSVLPAVFKTVSSASGVDLCRWSRRRISFFRRVAFRLQLRTLGSYPKLKVINAKVVRFKPGPLVVPLALSRELTSTTHSQDFPPQAVREYLAKCFKLLFSSYFTQLHKFTRDNFISRL